MVTQQDEAWRDQTGGPTDPQPGNVPGGSRDCAQGADFNTGKMDAFAPDSGTFAVQNGACGSRPTGRAATPWPSSTTTSTSRSTSSSTRGSAPTKPVGG